MRPALLVVIGVLKAAEVDLGFLCRGRVHRHGVGPRASYGR